MEWIKVKSEHISSEYSDAEVGALIRYQLLISRLKRVPTEKEILKEVRKTNWNRLKNSLNRLGIELKYIQNKVIEDIKYIQDKKEKGKIRKRKQRDTANCPAGQNKCVTKQIRGEERRGEERKEDERKEDERKEKYHKKKSQLEIAIDDFSEFRKKIKKPLTSKAKELLINKLNKMSSNKTEQIEIIQQSIVNGWQGIFPLKNNSKKDKDFEDWLNDDNDNVIEMEIIND